MSGESGSQGRRAIVPLALALVAFMLLGTPATDESMPWRWLVVHVTGLVLIVLLAGQLGRSGRTGLRLLATGPGPWILGLLVWLAVCSRRPATPGGADLSALESARWVVGAGVYFAVVQFLAARDQLSRLQWMLPLLGIGAAAAGAATWASSEERWAGGGFGNPQLLAAVLVVLLPLGLAGYLRAEAEWTRHVSLAFLGLGLPVLFLTQSRSGWAATVVSFAVLALLLRPRLRPEQKHRWVPGVVIVALTVAGFVWRVPEAARQVGERAITLAAPLDSASLQWRLRMWSTAADLIRESPLTGWGLGSFPFTAAGRNGEIPGAYQVEQTGPSLASMAHNEYLQVAAETGIPGLLLYLGVLVGFAAHLGRCWGRLRSQTRRTVAAGAAAALAGQAVDALANPAWRSAEVSPLLWLVLGLGVAATRSRWIVGETSSVPSIPTQRYSLAGLTWQLAAGMLLTLGLGGGATAAVLGDQPRVLRNFYDPRATPRMQVRPTGPLNFGRVRIGRAAALNLTIQSRGAPYSLIEGRVEILPGPDATYFSVIGASEFRLPTGRSLVTRIRFQPGRISAVTAQLRIRTNAGDQLIQLQGQGF